MVLTHNIKTSGIQWKTEEIFMMKCFESLQETVYHNHARFRNQEA